MTELRKSQNRMAFGKEEASIDVLDESVGLGMMGEGQIRRAQIDSRTKAKLSKKNLGWNAPFKQNDSHKLENALLLSQQDQGITLVNPSVKALEQKKEEKSYFSMHALPASNNQNR